MAGCDVWSGGESESRRGEVAVGLGWGGLTFTVQLQPNEIERAQRACNGSADCCNRLFDSSPHRPTRLASVGQFPA